MQLDAVISPPQGKVTPVSRHVDEYINECARYRETASVHPGGALDPQVEHRGGHPERYQNVMEGLVNYLLEVYQSRLGLDRSSFYVSLEVVGVARQIARASHTRQETLSTNISIQEDDKG